MYKYTVVIEATEALNSQRRGIGMQMRAWLEAAPFAAFPDTEFVIAYKVMDGAEPLTCTAENVQIYAYAADSDTAYIDHLYTLDAQALFFPIALEQYVRPTNAKLVAVDYGMEDLYCRNYIAPRSYAEHIDTHAYALRTFDRILTVSETSRRDLGWFFPEQQQKIEVIYPGLVTHHDAAADVPLRPELHAVPYFLVMGYEHKKNCTRIASAFDRFKQATGSPAKLVFVGKPGYGAEDIDAHIAALVNASDIHRLGYIFDAEKQTLLQHAHAVLALAIYEGFGISALEGLAAGKIVLVSDNGSLREVVGEAGYLADPFSVEAIASQLAFIAALTKNPKQQYAAERLATFDQAVQARRLLERLVDAAQAT